MLVSCLRLALSDFMLAGYCFSVPIISSLLWFKWHSNVPDILESLHFLSITPAIHLSIRFISPSSLSISLSSLSLHPVYPSVYPICYLPILLSIHTSKPPYILFSIHPSTRPPIHQSIFLSIRPSFCLTPPNVHLSFLMSIHSSAQLIFHSPILSFHFHPSICHINSVICPIHLCNSIHPSV